MKVKKKLPPIVELAIKAAEDVKGLDLKLLDVRAQTAVTDYMLLCTGTSNRHVRSIAENVIKEAKHSGRQPRGVEGLNSSEWVLVDLVDVVVHVMQAQTRVFYQLEKLWDVPVPEPVAEEKEKKPVKPRKSTKKLRRNVIPAKAGIQKPSKPLDARLRGHDGKKRVRNSPKKRR